jgi:peptidoglycan/xylan/chitin deacetylase (PgdA/CDA1 family)
MSTANYGENINAVHDVVPRLLELFSKYDIACTWATVGFLFNKNKKTLIQNNPKVIPTYANTSFSAYDHQENIGVDLKDDPLHYCGDLIQVINKTAKQEIASHTYSHYYCLEDGQDEASFEADCEAIKNLAKEKNIKITSLVFPRNQYNKSYLEICKRQGITSYRGIQKAWIYKERKDNDQNLLQRSGRLLNNYFSITTNQALKVNQIKKTLPINLPATRFLRPYSTTLSFLEHLRLRRIKNEMTKAAKQGCVYHLWWHPHNFGTQVEDNFKFLEDILKHQANLKKEYQFESISMGEFTKQLLSNK